SGVPFKNGHISDVVSIIYPWRIYGIQLLKQGISPLWIPQALAGTPLLANFQSAVLYPFNILFWFFSNANAWSLYIIIQPILAGIFCFLYLRNLKLSNFPSLFGSIIFAFTGFNLVWLEYGIVGHAGLWLPLMFLAIDKLSTERKIRWIFVGSVSIMLSLLAGYPQISLFSIFLTSVYILFRFLMTKERSYALGFVFIALGILLSAIQLFPGYELVSLSVRQIDPTTAAFNYGIVPLKNLVLGIAPDFFGNPSTGNFWGKSGYNESAFYVGIAGLLFSLFAFFKNKKDASIFFKIILVFSFLFAFETPLAYFLQNLNLPVLASASMGRVLFITVFSFSVLSAFGVEYFLKLKKKKSFVTSSLFLVLILGFVWFFVLTQKNDPNFLVTKRNLIVPTALLFSTLIVLWFTLLTRKFRELGLLAVFFILVFDLFRFGWKYNSFSSKDYLYPETKLTTFLENNSHLSRFTGVIPQSMFMPYDLLSVEGYEPLMTRRFNEFANQINEGEFHKISTGSRWVIVNRHESPLLNLMGEKYRLSLNMEPVSAWDPQYFLYSQKKYELVFQSGKSQIYENKQVLPRAFISHEFKVLKDEDILKSLMDENFDPTTLLLEAQPDQKPEKKTGGDKVQFDENSYFKNKVSLKTNSSSDGYLFLSDNYYPGWKALVDNKESKIYRADYTFRAIFLPKGEHSVEFIFEPKSYKIGWEVSLGTFLFLMSLLFYEVIKSKSSSSKGAAGLVRKRNKE
ncbi:MAG: YfhO family protein, partial [bacterium]|nr:YfhO family protein [bacterium]